MNKNKGIKIAKIVLAAFSIVLPLLVCFLICNYTYNRHIDNFLSPYYASVKYDKNGDEVKDENVQFEGYLKYVSIYYKKVDEASVLSNDEKVATISTYLVIMNEDGVDTIYYYFLASDLNYELITKMSYVGNESQYEFSIGDIPTVYLFITDGDDDDSNSRYVALDDFSDVVIRDYGHSPSKDSDDLSLENFVVQYGAYKGINLPSDNVTIDFLVIDDNGDNVKVAIYDNEHKLSVERVIVDIDDYSSFVVGFDSDPLKAGYVNYIFRKYWWWEAIVSIAMVGILTYSFYIVITYEKE